VEELPKAMLADRITQRNILRVLIVGFGLVILLLLAAGFMGVQNVRLIKESSARLVAEQLVTTRLIQGLQREQKTLNAVFYNLARTPDAADPDQIIPQLDESDQAIEKIVREAQGTREEQTWRELKQATSGFSNEVRRLLDEEDTQTFASADLLRRHQEVISLTARLLSAGYQKASAAQNKIESRSAELVNESIVLLGSSLLLALLCAVLTVRMTAGLFRQMENQANELSRVSWHMLENQETTARRFSHELHDELGQSLTAVKANLLAIDQGGAVDRRRLNDARQLIDEAIRNVRELSQLLRPVILDDFGLDAALRFLAEGFTERTGIDVEYKSDFEGRLQDETETHLFRIAQEGLTNIARHSGATRVTMQLHAEHGKLHMFLNDNGRGLEPNHLPESGGLGMIGMRARARSTGGELRVESQKGSGLRIDIWVPMHSERVVNDPHLVS
jgi:signal transduction histidine kinase